MAMGLGVWYFSETGLPRATQICYYEMFVMCSKLILYLCEWVFL